MVNSWLRNQPGNTKAVSYTWKADGKQEIPEKENDEPLPNSCQCHMHDILRN